MLPAHTYSWEVIAVKHRDTIVIKYDGQEDHTAFARFFYTQLLTELKGRGLLSEAQYLKSLRQAASAS